MPDIAYVNGRFGPLERAKISVEDRGFQFGDGVYELIRSYGGKPFHLEEHLKRLQQSLEAIRLPQVYDLEEWKAILGKALLRSGYREAKLYLQVTRGVAPRQHPFPDGANPTVVVTVREMQPFPEAYHREGISVITMPDLRWGRCDVKSINLLPNVLAKQKAREVGALEALFLRGDQVLEGAGSNVFALKGTALVTPPKGMGILSGVTRETVIGLAKEAGFRVSEEALSLESLLSADEVMLTATSMEVLPVVRVDGKTIGTGKTGPVQRQLYQGFLNQVRQL